MENGDGYPAKEIGQNIIGKNNMFLMFFSFHHFAVVASGMK